MKNNNDELLSEFTENVDVNAKLSALEAETRMLQRQIKILSKAYGQSLEFNDDLRACIAKYKPLKIPSPEKKSDKAEVALVILLGDWHTGERISLEEMDGANAYGIEIQQQRLNLFCAKVHNWIKLMRHGYRIDRAYILGLGDFLNGEIHLEYLRTNEITVPDAIVRAGNMLAGTVRFFAPMFPSIECHFIGADNHGRRTQKPQSKEAAVNNYNYPVYELACARLALQENVSWNFYKPLRAQFSIEGQSALVEHGHTVTSWMSNPYYGMDRLEAREAKKRMRLRRPFELHIFGHWHSPLCSADRVVNGALCGSTEYDAQQGRFAAPSQSTFLMSREHGHFAFTGWRLG